jgi:ERCC4-related helicase
MIISESKEIYEIFEEMEINDEIYIVTNNFTIYSFYSLYEKFSSFKTVRILINDDYEYVDESIGNDLALRQRNITKMFINYLQEKCYIKKTEKINGAIVISNQFVVINSQLDLKGIGKIQKYEMDINHLITSNDKVSDYKKWFMEQWGNNKLSKNYKEDFIGQLENYVKNYSSKFVYYFMLNKIFGDNLEAIDEKQESIGLYDTKIWDLLYEFQKDGVLGAINKIEKYNGCIIADSVGLGKTYEALTIIKYYELMNKSVLVLCPKKLRDNWTVYTYNSNINILKDDKFNYDVINHTDLSRDGGYTDMINLDEINWGGYDLVVIDESHNFRNNNRKDDRQTRYAKLMDEIIKDGIDTKLLMLSATPVNTSLYDLRNQIYLITKEQENKFSESMGINNLGYTIKVAENIFKKWSEMAPEGRKEVSLIDELNNDFFKLLDQLTISRSRNHVNEYYTENIDFPKRLKPKSIYSEIDRESKFITYKKLNELFLNLNLSIYTPSKFIKSDYKELYKKIYTSENNNIKFTQEEREYGLVHMMRINYLKRLESSVFSFTISIDRLLNKVRTMINKIENYKDEPINFNIYDIDLLDEDYDEVIGSNLKLHLKHIDRKAWIYTLREDYEILKVIYNECKVIDASRDKKLDVLKKEILFKINNPINKNNQKILIFTAFADTANYIYDNIHHWIFDHFGIYSALVTGGGTNKTNFSIKDSNRRMSYNEILVNFSPKSKQRHLMKNLDSNKAIDVLIGTDCISEGQNLQDCDYLINYDIHWNPVRIVQRFGRIDRIGSENKKIQLVNFWPSEDLNEYINLKNRVESRMEIVDISSSADDNLLKTSHNAIDNFRNNQLMRLKDEVLDMEDIDNNFSLTNFNFNDFRMDLKNSNYNFEDVPDGIFSIIENKNLEDGLIFCLESIKENQQLSEYNNLYPYYLAYITNTGNIKLNYKYSRDLLLLFKKIVENDNNNDLDRIFKEYDKQSKSGNFMINEMLGKLEIVAKNILDVNKKNSIKDLRQSRKAKILRSVGEDFSKNFKIISYLIIK